MMTKGNLISLDILLSLSTNIFVIHLLMKETKFYSGNQCQLLTRENEKVGEVVLVKTAVAGYASSQANMAILNEYEILKDLKMDGVRQAIGIEQNVNGPCLLLQYIDGYTLSKYFGESERTLEDFLKVAIAIAGVLEEVHRERIIHKDINPENILVNKSDNGIRIIDFGLAGKMDLKLQHLGNPEKLQGTLKYISPEQTGRMDRVIDSRSDLYSLGVTFYELLTGRLPFEGESPLELVHAHLAQMPSPPSAFSSPLIGVQEKVPELISRIVMHLLEKDPQDRYKGAGGLRHDLEQCLSRLQPDGSINEFELFTNDFSDRFILPEKLYGMDKEVDFLKEKFHEAGNGQTGVVMIKGYSGVGKSALVRALYRELSGKNGMLVSGKFDQLQKNIPHSAFIAAFMGLVELLQSENDYQLSIWRSRIKDALGGLGKVLTNVVPNLEQLIGIQEDVPELPTIEAQNRLEFLMREFVRCIADKDHPLLLFIDDMQWADEASLALFKQLSIESSINGLLFIGTYRDNEVDSTHPLHMTLHEIAAERPIEYIEVRNLETESINQLVADTLGRSLSETFQLATLIKEKTGGNAFFVFQFLKSLYESGGIAYNYTSNSWEWSDARIVEMKITDNVVDLLTHSLNKQPKQTLDALKMASCIGNTFRLGLLSTILNENTTNCFAILESAMREGFVSLVQSQHQNLSFLSEDVAGKLEFAFGHDRIQLAVYSLIPDEEKEVIHLRIGRLLLADKSKDEIRLGVFEIVNQLNHGVHLISEKGERLNLAGLNLVAGDKAKQSAAYSQSLVYFESGMELLGERPWQQNYDLCLSLYSGAAETAYLSGNTERMEAIVPEILSNAKNILDKIPVYNTLVDAYTAGHDLPKAIEAGLEALKGLGVNFPVHPKLVHVFAGLGKTKMKLAGKKIENLIDLPEMTNPYMLQAMPLMERISPAAYMSGSQLFPLLVFKMVDVSLQYGNSTLSAFGYASFAITLSGVLGDYDGGFRFAEMSKKLLEKYQDDVYKVKVYFVNYCFIRHWKLHANTMIEPLMEAYRSGLMAGNLFSGNWVACYALTWKYFTAQPLDQLKSELVSFTRSFRQLKQFGAFNLADILLQTVNRLTDTEDVRAKMDTEEISEEAMLQRCFDAHDKTAVFFLHLHRMQLNYLFGNYEEARNCAKDAAPYLEAVLGLHYIPLYHFYLSLIVLANPNSSQKDLKTVNASLKKMKVWSKHAPANYLHKFHLIEAELAARNNENDKARIAFDKAIMLSRENGYLQEEAIALERASLFYSRIGVDYLSQSMYQSMIKAYRNWGAHAKLKHLGAKDILTQKTKRVSDISSSYSTETDGTAMLDMESILKASAILAGEMDTNQLMLGFMRIIMENSGADRAVLLLTEQDKLIIKAGVSVKSNEVEVVDIPVDERLRGTTFEIPQSVIRFAMNSRKVITINDAGRGHEFKKDNYFADKQVKALTCMPLLNQNKLIGGVYLENSLLPDVFSEERKEVLNIIGSQFAVTLDNIRLYQHTRQLNVAYERFVPKQFLAYLNKSSIIDVQLGDNTQEVMTLVFLDIRGFTALSEQMTPQENFYFINEFLSIMEPVVRKFGGLIDKYMGDGIMAMFPGSPDKAVNAGSAMLRALNKFNAARLLKNEKTIKIGIGMHTGTIMLGTVGGSERMETTVIADAENIASRIEGLNKQFGTSFLVSGATLTQLESPGSIHKRRIGDVAIRGKENRITIYEIYDAEPENMVKLKDQTSGQFDEAVKCYELGLKTEARSKFLQVLNANPDDYSAKLYAEQCNQE